MHLVTDAVHEHLCPVVVIVRSTAGNLVEDVSVVVAAICSITAIEV